MNKFNFEEFYENFFNLNYSDNTSFDAALYSLKTGGKRFRFALSMNTAKAFNNDTNENSRRLAVAVELIHNYSLIHDDLPSMDNADERRGLPSCQKKYGEAQAILAGDGLLNSAAEILFEGQPSIEYMNACNYLFNCAGFYGMIGGQSLDIKNERLTLEKYSNLALLKTSKLICASLIPQAIFAKRNNNEIKQLEIFCNLLGLIYQFIDDLHDEKEDELKPTIMSFFQNKEDAKKYILKLSEDAREILNLLESYTFDFLEEYLKKVLVRLK